MKDTCSNNISSDNYEININFVLQGEAQGLM